MGLTAGEIATLIGASVAVLSALAAYLSAKTAQLHAAISAKESSKAQAAAEPMTIHLPSKEQQGNDELPPHG